MFLQLRERTLKKQQWNHAAQPIELDTPASIVGDLNMKSLFLCCLAKLELDVSSLIGKFTPHQL